MKPNAALAPIFAVTILAALAWQTDTAEAQIIVTDGLLGYWSFDNASITGETAKDAWGGSDGTILGDPQIVEGKIGEATHFDGTDDHVNMSDEVFPTGRDESSVSLWFNADQLAVRMAPFSYGAPVARQARGINITNATTINFWGWSDATKFNIPMIKTGEWHHLVAVYDGTFAKVYFDGEFKGELDQSDWNTQLPGIASIGRNAPADADYFSGIIDEVLFYNRALGEDEVKQNLVAHGLAVSSTAEKLTSTWGEIKVTQ